MSLMQHVAQSNCASQLLNNQRTEPWNELLMYIPIFVYFSFHYFVQLPLREKSVFCFFSFSYIMRSFMDVMTLTDQAQIDLVSIATSS